MTQPTFIVVTESTSESWKRDASTFALAFACFFPGWLLGMASMTILGVLILIYMTGRSVLKLGGRPMTADEARAKIDMIQEEPKDV